MQAEKGKFLKVRLAVTKIRVGTEIKIGTLREKVMTRKPT